MMCPYCSQTADLVSGEQIYPHRQELHAKSFYQCTPCDAYVGCHPGTTNALGRLANAELRKAKIAAHMAFDPIWRNGTMRRATAYAWLAQRLGIHRRRCHIGMFDVDVCQRVIEICSTKEEPR